MGGSEPLHRAVIQAAGKNLDALVSDVCTHPAERDLLTALAPAVTALAAEDLAARKIALKAAEHLAALAGSILRRLGPLPVAGAGGVFDAPVIWDRFAELTGAVRPLAAAAVGAALLAGQRQGDRAWTGSERCSARPSARAASPVPSPRSARARPRSAAGPSAWPTPQPGARCRQTPSSTWPR